MSRPTLERLIYKFQSIHGAKLLARERQAYQPRCKSRYSTDEAEAAQIAFIANMIRAENDLVSKLRARKVTASQLDRLRSEVRRDLATI